MSDMTSAVSAVRSGDAASPQPGAVNDAADEGRGRQSEMRSYCALPETKERALPNVSAGRAWLIRTIETKWVNGTKLRFFFFVDGPYAGHRSDMEVVRRAFQAWMDLGIGIEFEEVEEIGEAEVRIGFLRGDGAWSYVGRDVIDIPGQHERTMNFGWRLSLDPTGIDTAIHEVGHTLGFPHEHQTPFAGIEWDEEAVYTYFASPPNNWPRSVTFHNVLRKLSPTEVAGSSWDPDSIMHYQFAAGLIRRPPGYQAGLTPSGGISAGDIQQARRFYPPLEPASFPQLIPYESRILDIEPGEQCNYIISPDETRTYAIQTIGAADTVMVLFEDQGGDLKYVKGDDDSGTDRNTLITTRLYRGRRYVLRVRLYLQYGAGKTAVLIS
jgi:hypothetical protein